MPIPKDSKFRLPIYIVYYLVLALVFILVILSYLIPSFPLSINQLMVIFLVDVGGYGIVEEMVKARGESVLGRHRAVMILFLLVLLLVLASFLLLFVNLDISIYIMFGFIIGIWCCLMTVNWYSKRIVNAKENIDINSYLLTSENP
jgi:hypothetical protein